MTTALCKAFYAKAKVLLVEPLGSTVELGDVGYFDDGQWVAVGTTRSFFGLDLDASRGTSEPNSFDGKSGKGLTFEAFADGETSALSPDVASAKARAEITFGVEDSFVMNVKDQTVDAARDLAEVMSAIRYAYRYRGDLPSGRGWEKKYAVVVGVASALSVTALSASSRNATAVISGGAALQAPTAPVDLDASMKVTLNKNSVDKLWRRPADGYAIQALRIKPSVFTRWDREDFGYVKAEALRLGARRREREARAKFYRDWSLRAGVRVGDADAEFVDVAGSRRAEPQVKRARSVSGRVKRKSAPGGTKRGVQRKSVKGSTKGPTKRAVKRKSAKRR
jgi:hypothetical protein